MAVGFLHARKRLNFQRWVDLGLKTLCGLLTIMSETAAVASPCLAVEPKCVLGFPATSAFMLFSALSTSS